MSKTYAQRCKVAHVYFGLPFAKFKSDLDSVVEEYKKKFFITVELPELIKNKVPITIYGIYGFTALTGPDAKTELYAAEEQLKTEFSRIVKGLGNEKKPIKSLGMQDNLANVQDQIVESYKNFLQNWKEDCNRRDYCAESFKVLGKYADDKVCPRAKTKEHAENMLDLAMVASLEKKAAEQGIVFKWDYAESHRGQSYDALDTTARMNYLQQLLVLSWLRSEGTFDQSIADIIKYSGPEDDISKLKAESWLCAHRIPKASGASNGVLKTLCEQDDVCQFHSATSSRSARCYVQKAKNLIAN
jgi:hypothetical protein